MVLRRTKSENSYLKPLISLLDTRPDMSGGYLPVALPGLLH
jgi:hypothetical protein